jgi:hypothetical protein
MPPLPGAHRLRRSAIPAAALFAALALLPGCGQQAGRDAAPASAGGTSATNAAGATGGGAAVPGAPEPGQGQGAAPAPGPGGGQAPGAPILIPARVNDQGRPLDEVTAEITGAVQEECGGTLCITLRTEHRDLEGFSECQFVATEPPQRTSVPRGSTVVIVAGTAPCGTAPDSGTGGPTDTAPATETPPATGPAPDTGSDTSGTSP